MSEESLSPVELVRQAFNAGNRHDVDTIMGFHAPEAVWDLSDQGLGTFEGAAAIRGWIEDWFGTWADLRRGARQAAAGYQLDHSMVYSFVSHGKRACLATET